MPSLPGSATERSVVGPETLHGLAQVPRISADSSPTTWCWLRQSQPAPAAGASIESTRPARSSLSCARSPSRCPAGQPCFGTLSRRTPPSMPRRSSVPSPAPTGELGGRPTSTSAWSSATRARATRDFALGDTEPFSLLATPIGEDCAGGVEFVRHERLEGLLKDPGSVAWLSDEDLVERIRDMRRDVTAWRGETTDRT